MRKTKRNVFYAGKTKNSTSKSVIKIVLAVLLIAALGVGSFFAAQYFRGGQAETATDRSLFYCEPAFEENILPPCSDVKYYAGDLAVYTDASTGRFGLVGLDGKKITEAEYSAFSSANEGWHNTVFTATPDGQTFPRIVNVDAGKVEKKQYEAGENAGKIAHWNDKTNAFCAYDKLGAAGTLHPEELCLANGLYAAQGGESAGGKYGYLDENLNMVIAPRYDFAVDFSGGLGAVNVGGKWGFINENGETVLQPVYSSVGGLTVSGNEYCFGFSSGVAPVMKDGKMGLVAKDGKTVVSFVYDAILPGKGGKFIACKGGKWGVITLASLPEKEEPTSEASFAGGQYVVNTANDPLNVRSEPDTGAEIVGRVPRGQQVTVKKIDGDWARITYGDIEGWAAFEYLKSVDAQ